MPEKEPTKQQEGIEGMKFIEGHPVCGACLDGSHDHPTEPGDRHDCKNIDVIDGETHQCHCGFGGAYKDGEWADWTN